jgi:1-phosphofructokinase
MIITVTVNPAMDRTLEISGLTDGGLNIVTTSQLDAGGKGINVSKTVQSLGGETVATGFLGGETGMQMRQRLDHMGLSHDFVSVTGETRTNIKVFDSRSQQTTEFNELGPAVALEDLNRLMSKLAMLVTPGSIVVLSGSIPKTLPADTYARLIACVHRCHGIAFLDASGLAFHEALGECPDMIKPNRHELEDYFSRALTSEADFEAAGRHFLSLGIKHIIFSLGHEGAYYVNGNSMLRLNPLKIVAQSSVGAGDAFVGAFVYSMAKDGAVENALKLALTASAGAVTTKGTNPVEVSWINAHLKEAVIEHMIPAQR